MWSPANPSDDALIIIVCRAWRPRHAVNLI